MKKLVAFFGVFAFFATMAYSQNNDASVTQTGDENTAVSTQTGVSQDADISQTGNLNQANLTQGIKNNSADIQQNSGNSAYGAFINQVTVIQDGLNGEVDVDQTFTGSVGDNPNVISISQTLNTRTGDNRKPLNTVLQIGFGNNATQTMEYQGYQTIEQIGSGNTATQFATGDGDYNHNGQLIIQGEAGNEAIGYTAYQQQLKRFNNAKIEQYGEGTGSFATQIQSGETSKAYIYQDGSGNTAYQSQLSSLGTHNSLGSKKDEADIRQYGDNTTALQYQDSDPTANNKAYIIQNEGSDGSWAKQDQIGNSNMSTITQTGLGNTATSMQTNLIDPALPTFGNINTINQVGNFNTATVTQVTP